jgi:hypothetical protein
VCHDTRSGASGKTYNVAKIESEGKLWRKRQEAGAKAPSQHSTELIAEQKVVLIHACLRGVAVVFAVQKWSFWIMVVPQLPSRYMWCLVLVSSPNVVQPTAVERMHTHTNTGRAVSDTAASLTDSLNSMPRQVTPPQPTKRCMHHYDGLMVRCNRRDSSNAVGDKVRTRGAVVDTESRRRLRGGST